MHKITTRKGFRGPRRRRAGISVAKGQTIEVELTASQLKAIQADEELVVVASKPKKKPAKKKSAKKLVDEPESKEA
jgi:hypothetical protein